MVDIVGQSLSTIENGNVDWMGFTATYLSVPLFLVLWFGYKLAKGTKVIPLEECDLSGRGDE